jgi:hypothetical protein
MSLIESAPQMIPVTRAMTFPAAFAALAGQHQPQGEQLGQPAPAGQTQHRHQPAAGHEVGTVEPRADRPAACDSRIQRMPFCAVDVDLRRVTSSQLRRAFVCNGPHPNNRIHGFIQVQRAAPEPVNLYGTC